MKNLLMVLICVIFIVTGFLPGYTYYDSLDNSYSDPTEFVIEYEAESFDYSDGFTVVDDDEASGKRMLKSTSEDGVAFINISFEQPVENMVLYVEHKALNESSNLSYVYFDNQDGESVYTTEYDVLKTKRVWYGNAFGTYKLYIKGARIGHMIDKVVLKYQTVKRADDVSGDYLAHNPSAATLDLPEVIEVTSGSYFFEAEQGKYGDVSSATGYDEDASGGAYWYSESGTQTDPKANHKTSSKYKFKVNEKGKYKLWIRYSTPAASQKSTWFGIDDDNYIRLDRSAVEGWKWTSLTTFNLDEGWHTFDMKFRQSKQMIDCFILTTQTWFTPSGKGSVPGQPIIPDSRLEETRRKALKNTRIWINDVRSRADVPVELHKDELMIPLSNISKLLCLEKKVKDGYVVLTRGRQYCKLNIENSKAVVNGRSLLVSCIPKATGSTYLIPISVLEIAFGIDWEFDEQTNNLYIFDSYEENAREAEDGEITILENIRKDINIKIPHDNPGVKIRVFARQVDTDREGFGKQNFFDNFKLLSSGGYDYKYTGLQEGFFWSIEGWVECPTPYYKDGAFYTRRSDMQMEVPHDVMVSIVEDGIEDLFIARNLDGVKWLPDVTSTEEFKINTGGELFVDTTFENISYYIDYELGVAKKCTVAYRKVGDTEWKKTLSPMNDEKTGQFRGSIVKVKENTEYEIKAILYDESNRTISEKTAISKTKSTNVPVSKTIKLSEIYDGEGPLELQNICGTENGWIKIDCEGQMISTDTNTIEAVYISECHYLIFENAVVVGGEKYGINVTNESSNIHVRNCDISGWGPGDGFYDEIQGVYYIDGYIPNYLAGIKLYNNVENILIEKCYIHDANARTNPWTRPDGIQTHPCGTSGIYAGAKGGIVIRYNDIIGSDKHRFNDCIEGSSNFGLIMGGVGPNSDIYGNMFIYTQDDVLEADGNQMNLRIYENRGEQTLCGFSTASTTMGPAYIFNNLITNLGTEQNQMTGAAMKNGGSGPDGYIGKIYIFNNTFDTGVRGVTGQGGEWHAMMKNNIIVSRENKNAIENAYAKSNDDNFDYDYNILNGSLSMGTKTDGNENSIWGVPKYKNMDTYDFNLADGSIGIDSGIWIDGISDHYVIDGKADIGAYEKGNSLNFLPYRPIHVWADTYRLNIKNGEEATVTFHIGDVPIGQKYTIVKNKDYTWLEIVSPTAGEMNPNTEITVKIKADMTGYEYADGNGMLLLRTEEGYSVPITVYAYYAD